MELLRFLLCLLPAPALAEVGSFGECQRFFYGGREPQGLGTATRICQRHRGEPRFATLYDGARLAPRWAAYTLSTEPCPGQAERRSRWFVEPQLSSADASPEMSLESECSACGAGDRPAQALSAHYEDTAFLRGQLNPGGHHCGAGRAATFTLTNAVPLEPCFAQGLWRALQRALRDQLRRSCTASAGAVPYVVTGATPGAESIPGDEDREEDRERPPGRVSVPRHLWTAVCCHRAGPDGSFSLAFLAENAADARIQVLPVRKLEEKLAALHGTATAVAVFAGGCDAQGPGAQEVIAAVQRALKPSASAHGEEQQEAPDGDATLSFSSLAAWHRRFSELYREGALACALQRAAPLQCVLREQKHLSGSMSAAEGWPCDRLPCSFQGDPAPSRWCYTAERKEGSRVPCCSEPCSTEAGKSRYTCDRGDGRRVPCSPQYSAVTVRGQACREDFPCGLYGEGYFWCYTDRAGAWDYCCAPHHYCGEHGYGYSWCYVYRDSSRWKYCSP